MELLCITRQHKPPRPVLLDDNEEVVELVSHYLGMLASSARSYSSQTVRFYAKQLMYFCEFLGADRMYARLPLDHVLATIPGGVIDQYLAALRQHGLESSTIRTRDVILKGFFEWLTTSEAGKTRESSGYESGLKSRSGKRKMPRFVTKQQVISLLNHLHDESQRCVIHFMYDTGLRVSEVPRVTKDAIDDLEKWPRELAYLPLLVLGSKGRGGNNTKERYALVSRAVYSRIKRYQRTASYRFTNIPDPKPAFLNAHREALGGKSIQKWVSSAAKRAGMAARAVSPHRLRHGTALSFLQGEAGQDYLEKLVLIKTQFGHSDIRSTESYTHIPPSLFTSINGDTRIKARFVEAQEIYDATYLPLSKHKERRGRKKP